MSEVPPSASDALAKMGDLAAEAGLRHVHVLSWRDFDDLEAGGSELHAERVTARWAEAGLDVTIRTSFAVSHPTHVWRGGRRVIRKGGRYLVFPRAAFSEAMGWHGPRDGLVEIWNGMPFFSPLWATGPRVTFLHHHHAEMWDMALPPRLAAIGRTLESRVAPLLYSRTSIVTLSESSRRELIDEMGLRPKRITVVPPGIDQRFTPGGARAAEPLVVAVGRLVPVKRFDLLIDVLAEVRLAVPGLRAVIVGEGYKREELEAARDAADAVDWLELPGRLDDDELVALYRRAWVVTSASAREGWGMTLTEAAACGTPAVVTRIAGHADAVLDGATGLLVDGREGLVSGLTRVLSDADLRDRLARGALARAGAHLGCHRARDAPGACGRRCAPPPGSPAVIGTPPGAGEAGRAPSTPHVDQDRARRRRTMGYAALAALAYVPALASHVGEVSADTKNYLYLDAGRVLDRALSVWDPHFGLGTVSHQNVGYLFPMGPFFWLGQTLGVPTWFAQGLWLGSLLFLAGLGVVYLLRTLGVRGVGVAVAAVAYMLSPYLLQYSSKHSVVALPWVALPWMIALVARALRDGGWRYPAAFAIVVQLSGSVNATALLLAGIAPALWVPYAVWGTREVDWRRALATVGRILVLTIVASLWWIAALVVQGRYGIDVLRFTETVQTVSATSTAPDVLRGLGYWYFYGSDFSGLWNEASNAYTQNLFVITTSFLVPIFAMAAAAILRWRYRAYFVVLVVVGLALAVGAFPYDDPSSFGDAFRQFAEGSSAGLALRSSNRAAPLVVLGLAVLLGVGVGALSSRLSRAGRRRLALVVPVTVIVLAIVNVPALWTGDQTTSAMLRPSEIPTWWRDAIDHLDAGSHETRIFEIPGADFANYQWGGTVEPITPGLTDRPYVARESVPYGSEPGTDLLNAFDRQLQERVLSPESVPAFARLIAAGQVVTRDDLDVDRYGLVRPDEVWNLLHPRPAGLGSPTGFGSPRVVRRSTQVDERSLSTPTATQQHALEVYPVEDAVSIVRAASEEQPLVLAGSGEGVVDAASVGLLDSDGVLLYSGDLADHPAQLRAALRRGATLVVTDSNRRRAQRWTALHEIFGYTERAGEHPARRDTFDARVDLFPAAGDDARTVTVQRGGVASATGYGAVDRYLPEDRASRAFDGEVRTAWRVAGRDDPVGEQLRLELDAPITADAVNLVQPLNGDRGRWITAATLRFDGGRPVSVLLGDESRTADGQTVTFPAREFRNLELTIDATNSVDGVDVANNPVGFAEVRVADATGTPVRIDEVVRMPVDLVDAVGAASADHRLVYLMTRQRTIQSTERLGEDESSLVRAISVPTARSFDLRGRIRLAATAPDEVLDRVLGPTPATAGGRTVTSSGRLAGDAAARASSALDGDPSTAWTTPLGAPRGQWIEVAPPAPVTTDHAELTVVADGRHSVPTRLRIDGGGASRTVDVPPIEDARTTGAVVTVPLSFDPLTASDLRVTIDAVRPVTSYDPDLRADVLAPVSISELGLAGLAPGDTGASLESAFGCRTDLVTVDGAPVAVRVDGTNAALATGRAVDLRRCDEAPITLGPGEHEVRAAEGSATGLDVDSITVASDSGGAPLALGSGGSVPPAPQRAAAPPKVKVLDEGADEIRVRIEPSDEPVWLVLGQSHNAGWTASVGDEDLGSSTLVDGYANGWRVAPSADGGPVLVTLEWTPQRAVWLTYAISGLALVLCALLALGCFRRRPSVAVQDDGTDATATSPFGAVGGPRLGVPAIVGGGVVVAVAGLVLAHWWVGVVAAAAFVVAALRPRWRAPLLLGPPVSLALAAGYIVVQQYRIDYEPLLEWPAYFVRVHELGWLAAILLGASAVLEVLERRRARVG